MSNSSADKGYGIRITLDRIQSAESSQNKTCKLCSSLSRFTPAPAQGVSGPFSEGIGDLRELLTDRLTLPPSHAPEQKGHYYPSFLCRADKASRKPPSLTNMLSYKLCIAKERERIGRYPASLEDRSAHNKKGRLCAGRPFLKKNEFFSHYFA